MMHKSPYLLIGFAGFGLGTGFGFGAGFGLLIDIIFLFKRGTTWFPYKNGE
jgi:hypothetical protein